MLINVMTVHSDNVGLSGRRYGALGDPNALCALKDRPVVFSWSFATSVAASSLWCCPESFGTQKHRWGQQICVTDSSWVIQYIYMFRLVSGCTRVLKCKKSDVILLKTDTPILPQPSCNEVKHQTLCVQHEQCAVFCRCSYGTDISTVATSRVPCLTVLCLPADIQYCAVCRWPHTGRNM